MKVYLRSCELLGAFLALVCRMRTNHMHFDMFFLHKLLCAIIAAERSMLLMRMRIVSIETARVAETFKRKDSLIIKAKRNFF